MMLSSDFAGGSYPVDAPVRSRIVASAITLSVRYPWRG
jgi:hypothetical protein